MSVAAVRVTGGFRGEKASSGGWKCSGLKRGATGDLRQVVRELIALDDAGLDLAVESLAGQVHASQQWMAVLDSETFTDMVRQEITLDGGQLANYGVTT